MRPVNAAAAFLSSLLSLGLLPVVALAAPPPSRDAVRAEARERFDRGLRLFEEGDNAGALAEFRRVNELSPNRLVLFNIGMVYAAMNRPVESADTLAQVLNDPGPLTSDRQALARTTHEQQQARIAVLAVSSNTPAAIEVDGVEVGRTPEKSKVRVPSGTHVVGALAPGHLPSRREVTVAGGATAEVRFELLPTESSLAHIDLSSPVPGAEVFIDGALAGRTPLPASLPVPAGNHVIEVRRAGYHSARRELALGEGARGQLRLDLDEDTASPASRGTLVLKASEREASLTVDGKLRGVDPGPLPLPAGPHRIRVDRPGFQPVEREVVLAAGRETVARVTLTATPETRLAYVSRVRGRRTLAWGTTLGGAALAIAGGAAALWAQSSLPDARDELTGVKLTFERFGGGDCDPAKQLSNEMMALCGARLSEAEDEVSQRKLVRTLGFVGLGVGVAAAAVGTYLVLSGEDANRYDLPRGDEPLARRLLPLAWVDGRGGGFGLAARF
jgi:hypothetical protein